MYYSGIVDSRGRDFCYKSEIAVCFEFDKVRNWSSVQRSVLNKMEELNIPVAPTVFGRIRTAYITLELLLLHVKIFMRPPINIKLY